MDEIGFARACRLPVKRKAEDQHDEAGRGRKRYGQRRAGAPIGERVACRLHDRDCAERIAQAAHRGQGGDAVGQRDLERSGRGAERGQRLGGAEQVENGPAKLLRIVRIARDDRTIGVGQQNHAVGCRRPGGHDALERSGIAIGISAQVTAGIFKPERYLIGQGLDRLARVAHDLPALLEHLHHRADADRQQKGDDERRHGASQKRFCAEKAAVGRLGD